MLAARFRAFLADESGATAIEYALIAMLIAMALISSAVVMGNSLKALYNNGMAEILARQAAKI